MPPHEGFCQDTCQICGEKPMPGDIILNFVYAASKTIGTVPLVAPVHLKCTFGPTQRDTNSRPAKT